MLPQTTMTTTSSAPHARALEIGVDALGDGDLVALLLGTGRRGAAASVVAAELLAEAGGLDGVARAGAHALARAAGGLGTAKALRLTAAVELGRRAGRLGAAERRVLSSAGDVAAYLGPQLRGLVHEEMWVVSLDGRNRLRAARRVAQGGLHGCAVSARDVLRSALADAASAFVLVHNHPSGDPTPSGEDVLMTAAVARAARIVGVPLVDHVVIAGARHASLLELGVLDEDDARTSLTPDDV